MPLHRNRSITGFKLDTVLSHQVNHTKNMPLEPFLLSEPEHTLHQKLCLWVLSLTRSQENAQIIHKIYNKEYHQLTDLNLLWQFSTRWLALCLSIQGEALWSTHCTQTQFKGIFDINSNTAMNYSALKIMHQKAYDLFIDLGKGNVLDQKKFIRIKAVGRSAVQTGFGDV